jgi:hypothetical protein
MIRLSPHKPTSGDPGWPKYDLQRRATMRFDTTSGVVELHGLRAVEDPTTTGHDRFWRAVAPQSISQD